MSKVMERQISGLPQTVGIPLVKGMHSVNAVVAASIAVYADRLH